MAPEEQRSPHIPYGMHHIDESDVAAVMAVLRSPLITQGPRSDWFEQALGRYLGAEHVCVVANGTAALHLAYAALDLGPGDEIITSPITFSATAAAAMMMGARARFCDVDPNTGNIDVASAAAMVNGRTRGITAVHLGGLPADLASLRHLCDRHGLWLVEDAAHALGATYHGAMAGSCVYSDAATFSFHPVKHIATGEGGAVVSRDPRIAARVRRLRHHGIVRDPGSLERSSPGPWYYEVCEAGFNYRLSEIPCALGISQLERHPARLRRRRAIAGRYRSALARVLPNLVQIQPELPGRESAYHLLIALIDFAATSVERGQLMTEMRRRGVGTQVHYIPLPHHPAYRESDGEPADRPGVAAYYQRTLSLPMFPELSNREIDHVVDVLAEALGALPEGVSR